jgi:hypothetical protein
MAVDVATEEEVRRIIRLIETNAEIREAVRRAILTDELLELPDKFARFVESMNEFRTSMEQFRDVTEKRLDHLESGMGRLESRVGRLEGGHFENKWKENGTAYLGSKGFRRVRLIDKSTLANLLDDAVDSGALDGDTENDILLVDAVHSAVDKGSSAAVYIATEVSGRVHAEDVERAMRRAASLEAATGTSSMACVAGASIDDIARAMAEEGDVIVVLPAEWDRPQIA